ncbi:YicC/YloC family endoribonuclease [Anatilimnocola aggregata]|nr:YicC/YloC family endoribonuclease [Anatilimnocola aggregata]
MLSSMTGHGEAHRHQDGLSVAVEVRSVNNRYFKLNFRASEGYAALETQVEALVRQQVRRGTVQLSLRVDRQASPDDYRLNAAVIAGYMRQLNALAKEGVGVEGVRADSLLQLPGVVCEPVADWALVESHWPIIEGAVKEAVTQFAAMRAEEGATMAVDMRSNCALILKELQQIELRAPLVIDAFRTRIVEKLNKLLSEMGTRIEPADVVREIGIFSERSDISEEIVRLKSHLEQFETAMQVEEAGGRKLDFLTQEMFRETNTIGSKANDAQIAHHVIEIKTAIERVREMIQNIE